MTRWRLPLWTLMGVVLIAALVIGSGVLSSTPPTAAQRADAIESVVRCPSCEDLSVANSSASTAVTVRATVRQLVDQGRTDRQIEDFLVARYGSAIVLDPPASGWSLLVWLLPLLGGVAAVVVLGVFLVRRAGPVRSDPIGDDDSLLTADAASLEDRRQFLDRSLADADAEYLAGDLADQDYLALRQRDLGRRTAVAARLAELEADGVHPGPGGVLVAEGVPGRAAAAADAPVGSDPPGAVDGPASGPPRRRRWWFLGGAVAAFGAALLVAVTLFASDRLPGQTASGSVDLSQSQQVEETLAQAATVQNQGELGQAAQLYQSVLDKHSDNAVALAQLGWLEFETGRQGNSAALIADGRAKLNRAVRLDPHDYAVRLYLGTVLLEQDADANGAVGQYRQFLADGPPASLVTQAAPELRQAYREAGQTLPTGVPAD